MGKIKVQRKKGSPKTQSGSKRQKKVTRIVKAEPANKKKKPNAREKRSSKGQNLKFTLYMPTFSSKCNATMLGFDLRVRVHFDPWSLTWKSTYHIKV